MRVSIVYEHALFAHGIKGLLGRDRRLRIVGLFERPAVAPGELKRLKPDVVVIEGNGGIALLESLEGVVGVAISLRGDEATILTGLPVRVSGPEELARAIREVAGQRRRTGRKAALPGGKVAP